jgi:hypothetical protein
MALSPAVVTQYEVMRSAMLGAVLPAEARRGLNVFLNRGMWAWACMLVTAGTRPEPIPTQPPPQARPFERNTVVYALAGMAMTFNKWRTL